MSSYMIEVLGVSRSKFRGFSPNDVGRLRGGKEETMK
jgi:hypothetical protein